ARLPFGNNGQLNLGKASGLCRGHSYLCTQSRKLSRLSSFSFSCSLLCLRICDRPSASEFWPELLAALVDLPALAERGILDEVALPGDLVRAELHDLALERVIALAQLLEQPVALVFVRHCQDFGIIFHAASRVHAPSTNLCFGRASLIFRLRCRCKSAACGFLRLRCCFVLPSLIGAAIMPSYLTRQPCGCQDFCGIKIARVSEPVVAVQTLFKSIPMHVACQNACPD